MLRTYLDFRWEGIYLGNVRTLPSLCVPLRRHLRAARSCHCLPARPTSLRSWRAAWINAAAAGVVGHAVASQTRQFGPSSARKGCRGHQVCLQRTISASQFESSRLLRCPNPRSSCPAPHFPSPPGTAASLARLWGNACVAVAGQPRTPAPAGR